MTSVQVNDVVKDAKIEATEFRCSYPRNNDTCNCSCPSETYSASSTVFYDKVLWKEITRDKALPVIDPKSISYKDFFSKYLIGNIPCLFSSDITSSWSSRKKWVVPRRIDDEHGKTKDKDNPEDNQEEINFDFLLSIYGDAEVTVVNCNDDEYKNGYGTRDCREMLFSDFIKLFRTNDLEDLTSSSQSCLYLKDWHIVRFHKTLGSAHDMPYEVPTFFKSDWLNEACKNENDDDFKFCYFGPKGSFTSFHADVYGSYSWSANVFGVKKWYLYPPGKELRFACQKSGKLRFNWDDPGIPGKDFIEVIQNGGECLFVPSGWHHVVWNMTDAISINHNWFNGANICYIWKILEKALIEVEKELEEFRDIPEFHDQCQLVLKANHGMNFENFFQILEKTKKSCEKENSINIHANYDFEAIRHVTNEHCMKNSVVLNKMQYNEQLSGFS